MRLLLDTNILVALMKGMLAQRDRRIAALLASPASRSFVSAASLWEIAIKARLGKLDLHISPDKLSGYVVSAGLSTLVIDDRHAVADVDPEPATRDPFDRLLLGQCVVEGLELVTFDRVLLAHPLAWHPA